MAAGRSNQKGSVAVHRHDLAGSPACCGDWWAASRFREPASSLGPVDPQAFERLARVPWLTLKPGEVVLVAASVLSLAFEEGVSLGQYQRVRPPDSSGLVIDGEFGGVDPGVHVAATVLRERPLEPSPCRILEKCPEVPAQLAVASCREFDRPVVARARWDGEARRQGRAAVAGDRVEPGRVRSRRPRRPEDLGRAANQLMLSAQGRDRLVADVRCADERRAHQDRRQVAGTVLRGVARDGSVWAARELGRWPGGPKSRSPAQATAPWTRRHSRRPGERRRVMARRPSRPRGWGSERGGTAGQTTWPRARRPTARRSCRPTW